MVADALLHDPGYITGAGPDTSVLVGAFLELLLTIANIVTATALFPVVKIVGGGARRSPRADVEVSMVGFVVGAVDGQDGER